MISLLAPLMMIDTKRPDIGTHGSVPVHTVGGVTLDFIRVGTHQVDTSGTRVVRYRTTPGDRGSPGKILSPLATQNPEELQERCFDREISNLRLVQVYVR